MEKVVQVGGPNGFVVRKVVVPPVPVDCSEFRDDAEGSWAVGEFVKNNLLVPPVTADCSQPAEPLPPTEPKE